MKSLTHYTNSSKPAANKEVFTSFVYAFKKINQTINDVDISIIKGILEEEKVTASELHKALIDAYKDYNRYGKVEFNLIWKHIEQNRKSYKPKNQRDLYADPVKDKEINES